MLNGQQVIEPRKELIDPPEAVVAKGVLNSVFSGPRLKYDVGKEALNLRERLIDPTFHEGLVGDLDYLDTSIHYRRENFEREGLSSLLENEFFENHDDQSFHFLKTNREGFPKATFRLIFDSPLKLPAEDHKHSENLFQRLRDEFKDSRWPLLEVSRVACDRKTSTLLNSILKPIYRFGRKEDVGAFVFGMSHEMFSGLYKNLGFTLEGEFDEYKSMKLPCVIATWRLDNTNPSYLRRFERD